ncbi:MAG: hypothetical protein Q9226_007753, partial [Calogaya cf. arnoldii]
MADKISLSFSHHGRFHTFDFPPSATISDLAQRIYTSLSIPQAHQKIMITPKLGILKYPFPNPILPLSSLLSKKILLLAPLPSELSSLSTASQQSNKPTSKTPTAKPS